MTQTTSSKLICHTRSLLVSVSVLSLGYYFVVSPLLNRFLYNRFTYSYKDLSNESLDSYARAEGTKILKKEDGTHFEYFSHPSGSRRRYLLVFPSFLQTAAGFVTNYKSFLEKNEINVLVVSLPGCGLSSFVGNSEKNLIHFSQDIVKEIINKEWPIGGEEHMDFESQFAVLGIEFGMKFAMSCFTKLVEESRFKNIRLALFSPASTFSYGTEKFVLTSWLYSIMIHQVAALGKLFEEQTEGLQVYDKDAVKTDVLRSFQLGFGPFCKYMQNFPPEIHTQKQIESFIRLLNTLSEKSHVKRIFITLSKESVAIRHDDALYKALLQLKEEKHEEGIPDTVYDFQEFSDSEGSFYYINHFMELISSLFDIQTLFLSPI